ncbi:ataxin-1-like [Synchiropus splendidus]|uniref:ataxin-1-like n=1 Tax=Synchiropus splendidus TaxID=270530 RepID=UPI00237E6887|nr:ataxin-1-like [Synchiropus splendidus]
MKPAQERNQECLPPKKRDHIVSNSGGVGGAGGATGGGGGTRAVGSVAGSAAREENVASAPNNTANSDATSGEWVRHQPGVPYGVEGSDGMSAVPLDQYSMLYKVALPSPTSLHPVLSHISPAYTVHSPLLQHPGLSYPPLGYQIPHSSLQFVSSPYATLPYALPSGIVPGSLISPSGTIPQAHAVSHLVPYPSVIQEGVVSPPPQAQVAAHTFAKVTASSGVPLVLPSEQAAQQHIGSLGILPAAELGSRALSVYYHPQAARAAAATRELSSNQQENEAEMNGGDKEPGARDCIQDYNARNARLHQIAVSSEAQEQKQDRGSQSRRLGSPCPRSTSDTDLEVQLVVGRQGVTAGRKEVSFAPLNLSQGVQRTKELHVETTGMMADRPTYTVQPVSINDPRLPSLQQHVAQSGHTVMLANNQPVLLPMDYHLQQQQTLHHQPQQHVQTNDGPSNAGFKSRACLSDGDVTEVTSQQPPQPPADVTPALASSVVPAPAACNPSHFMKGAIIQLATGELKRVEDLKTQDFVRSAEVSGGLKIDSSMVMDIRPSQQRPGLVSLHFTVGEQQSRVTIDVPPEHPFFVFGQGWSSYSPERTAQLYGLTCHHLQIGDVCVSITLQQQQQQQQSQSQQQKQSQHHQSQQQSSSRTPHKTITISSESGHQLMGPPAPQHSRSLSQSRVERIQRERHRDADVVDKEEATTLGVGEHLEQSCRPSRNSAEHPRSHSSYHLHTEASAFTAGGLSAVQAALGSSQRRWSSPGLQRFNMKGDEGSRPQLNTSGHSRPSFIPQEVKLSIEGRSNAGK